MKNFIIVCVLVAGHLSAFAALPLQGSGHDDRKLTQMIREQIIRDNNLSVYAQNVKIITLNGQVVLKGPVLTRAEANRIVSKAESIVGVSSVINEMDVVAK